MLAVSPGQPSSISDDAEVVTLIGSGQDAANLINQKEIHWGVSQAHSVNIFTTILHWMLGGNQYIIFL